VPNNDPGPEAPGQLDRGRRSCSSGSSERSSGSEEAPRALDTLTLTEERAISREGWAHWTGRWTIHTGNGTLWAEHLTWKESLRVVTSLAEWLQIVREVTAHAYPRLRERRRRV